MFWVSTGEGHPCNPQQPLSFNFSGLEVIAGANARASLVFTPAFPCGIERGATFGPGDDLPLREIGQWSGCVGEGCPGDMVLIRGHVAAQQVLLSPAAPTTFRPGAIGPCEGMSTYPRLKLSVWWCGAPGAIIIDADSQIVVPAGMVRIVVLGPSPSTPASSDFNPANVGIDWKEGEQRIEDETLLVVVNLRITACPLRCCYCPPGVLSEYLHTVGDDAAVPLINRILIRPRRAKRLEMSPLLPTGAAVGLLLDTTATLPLVGQIVFGTGAPAGALFQTVEVFGAWPALFLSNSAGGTQRVAIRWEIV